MCTYAVFSYCTYASFFVLLYVYKLVSWNIRCFSAAPFPPTNGVLNLFLFHYGFLPLPRAARRNILLRFSVAGFIAFSPGRVAAIRNTLFIFRTIDSLIRTHARVALSHVPNAFRYTRKFHSTWNICGNFRPFLKFRSIQRYDRDCRMERPDQINNVYGMPRFRHLIAVAY